MKTDITIIRPMTFLEFVDRNIAPITVFLLCNTFALIFGITGAVVKTEREIKACHNSCELSGEALGYYSANDGCKCVVKQTK